MSFENDDRALYMRIVRRNQRYRFIADSNCVSTTKIPYFISFWQTLVVHLATFVLTTRSLAADFRFRQDVFPSEITRAKDGGRERGMGGTRGTAFFYGAS